MKTKSRSRQTNAAGGREGLISSIPPTPAAITAEEAVKERMAEVAKIEAQYWSAMRDYQALGQLIAAKEVELLERQKQLNEERTENEISKRIRTDLAMRLGRLADRIAGARVF